MPRFPADHVTRYAFRVGCPFKDQSSVGVLPTMTAAGDDTSSEKQYKWQVMEDRVSTTSSVTLSYLFYSDGALVRLFQTSLNSTDHLWKKESNSSPCLFKCLYTLGYFRKSWHELWRLPGAPVFPLLSPFSELTRDEPWGALVNRVVFTWRSVSHAPRCPKSPGRKRLVLAQTVLGLWVAGAVSCLQGKRHRVSTASPGAALEADREAHCEKKPSSGLGVWGEKRAHNSCCRISALKKLFPRISLVAQMAQCLPTGQESWVRFLGQEDPLEKEMATRSSTLAWKIPWTEDPGSLQPMGSQRVRNNWAASLSLSRPQMTPSPGFLGEWIDLGLNLQDPFLGQGDSPWTYFFLTMPVGAIYMSRT